MRYLFLIILLTAFACSKDEDSPYSPLYEDIKGTWKKDVDSRCTDIYNFSEAKDSTIKITYCDNPQTAYPVKYFIDKGSNDVWISGIAGWANLGKASFKDGKMYLNLSNKDKPFYR